MYYPESAFTAHPSLDGVFKPDPSGNRLFESFTLLGGEVGLGWNAALLTNLQLGAIALDTMGLTHQEIADIYTESEPVKVTVGSINDRLAKARRKLGVPSQNSMAFPRALELAVLNVRATAPNNALQIDASMITMIAMLSGGMQSKEVGGRLGIAPGTVRSRLNKFGRETGLVGGKMAATSLIMAGYLKVESLVTCP